MCHEPEDSDVSRVRSVLWAAGPRLPPLTAGYHLPSPVLSVASLCGLGGRPAVHLQSQVLCFLGLAVIFLTCALISPGAVHSSRCAEYVCEVNPVTSPPQTFCFFPLWVLSPHRGPTAPTHSISTRSSLAHVFIQSRPGFNAFSLALPDKVLLTL